MSRYIIDIGAMLVKKESVNGEYIEPDILVPSKKGVGVLAPTIDKIAVDPMKSHQGAKYSIAVADFAEQSVDVEIPIPASSTLIDEMLKGCWVEGVEDDGVTTYKFKSGALNTISIKQITQRVTTKITGACGNFKISAKAGEVANISFNFKGRLKEQTRLASSAADNSIPDAPDFEHLFMRNDCSVYLINGNGAVLRSFDFDLGANVVLPKDTCSKAYIQDYEPKLSIAISDTIENEMAFEDIKNGVAFNIVLPLYDINGNKKMEIVTPKAVAIEDKNPTNEGIINIERTLELRAVNGDDNFEIRFFN